MVIVYKEHDRTEKGPYYIEKEEENIVG